jgi:hypothetical protein
VSFKQSSLKISQVPASGMQHWRQAKETFLIKSIVEEETASIEEEKMIKFERHVLEASAHHKESISDALASSTNWLFCDRID